MQVFSAEGFHRTSMDEIARAAGVTKPVVYQHFGSKRELYLELLDDVGGRLLAAIAKATAEASNPRQQVEYGFRAYFRFVAAEPAAFTLLFGSGARRDEQFNEAVRRLEADIAEAIAPLIDADIDDEQRLLLAHALVGVAESTSRRWVSGRLDLDPDRVAAQVADLAWSGLRGVRRL
jgi:AcrR family transcriptional regulator